MQENNFDIIIIGAGAGGLNIASFCGNIGLRTLLIDKSEKHIGGDCLNYGCIPSKAFIHQSLQAKTEKNVDIKKITQNINKVIEHIRETENSEYLKKTKNIEIELGAVKFISKNQISINEKTYTGNKFVLATGSRPRELAIQNDQSIKIYNNENVFTIDQLPNQFVFIGGGPINCELGQSFARLGSNVTILHSGARILEKEDEKVSQVIASHLQEAGIKIVYNIKTKEIKNGEIIFENENGEQKIKADAVFAGIGRQLNIESLDLEKAGVDFNENKSKLVVDDYLQTTNKTIFVVGDVAGNYMFTHAAEMHAKVVINNLFSPIKKKFDDKNIAWVTFTDPEVATFGKQESDLKKLNISYEVLENNFEHDDRALTDGRAHEFVKIFIDKNHRILGGVMVAKNAGEISREYIIAMTQNLKIEKLFDQVYPYPIASRINRALVGQLLSKKLTPFTKKIFRFLF